MRWRLRPARDHGLTEAQRLRSQHREGGLGSALVQAAWRSAIRGWLAAFHRLAVTGREHLPAAPPFVLVSNHQSHLDALVLGSALRGEAARACHALAAGDTFFDTLPAAAMAAYAVNALPMWRQRDRWNDIAGLRARLVEDRLVFLLFPEGTRSRDGTMAAFHPGLGALVAGTAVPVVPCHIAGAFAAWPPGAMLPRPRAVRVRIGAPLEFAALPHGRAGWTAAAAACEHAVRRLGRDLPR